MKKSLIALTMLLSGASMAASVDCKMIEKNSQTNQKTFTNDFTAEIDANGDADIVERNKHFDVGNAYATSIAKVRDSKIEEVRVVLNDGWGVRSSGIGQRKRAANVEMGISQSGVSFSASFSCRIKN